MATVIIVHGLGGNSRENWFPWLKRELEKLGHSVIVPDFPDSENPELDKWLAILGRFEIGSGDILIGHSLGCPFILNVLERFEGRVKAVFLVAGFVGLLGISDIDGRVRNIAVRDFDWEKIRSSCKKFYAISSDDDPYVPITKARQLALNLASEVIVMKGKAHFNDKIFPELLELVKNEL
ncbi:serine hydrolase family protein [Candidatus Woesearchaeota archaeon]|nr:serine hydrolase family protein [Candidatus Woesearchaeota archaeon]